MEYYSAIKKKNKIMPFAAIWTNQEIVILSEEPQTSENALMASSSLEPTKETYQFPQGSPGDVSMH